MLKTESLLETGSCIKRKGNHYSFLNDLITFNLFGRNTEVEILKIDDQKVHLCKNEFWTSKQRACHSIHEISYRACFKPQLPGFFISRLCKSGDTVYDPFLGRGTTLVEARLNSCNVIGNDINPLSRILTEPRLDPPSFKEIEKRLRQIPTKIKNEMMRDDLRVFYHINTLEEICALREYFKERRALKKFDMVDKWILMVATNKLTGHSKGFFSVYTLPPNQAATIKSQAKINKKRNQVPEYRNTKEIISKKTLCLLSDSFSKNTERLWSQFYSSSADKTESIKDNSVDLVVTSPPFLDIVDYIADNWLRIWFTDTSFDQDLLWQIKDLNQWMAKMKMVMLELKRILKRDGTIAFEVGEVRNSKVSLDFHITEVALAAGLAPICIMRNEQTFTKTSNCWGVSNNKIGTNSNRIVVLKKLN